MIAEYLFQFVTIACMDKVTLHASTPVVLNFYEIHKINYIYYHFSILWRHGWLKLFFVEDPAGDNLNDIILKKILISTDFESNMSLWSPIVD